MESIRYTTSLFTFYLKGEINSEKNFINFKVPNTILGLIPLGTKKDSMAIHNIASTSTSFKLKLGKMLLGVLAVFLGFALFESSVLWALIVLLIGANWVIDAFEIDLVVRTNSGEIKIIDFLIFEKSKAEEANKAILSMISQRLDDTNNREQTDRIVDAINKK